ncbi:MAG: glycosyltransferase [Luteitalea sp.]|nr:glycosyltransferase [Luteitalea sp.]
MRAQAMIPAYNEVSTIARVVRGVAPHVERVLVVDDGSTDRTGEAARQAGADVISHTRNLGKGRAVRAGLAVVLASPATHLVVLDGDLQHVPDEVPRLLDTARRSGADLVIGGRRFDRAAMPASRYYANVTGSRVLSWFVGLPLRDTQSGFRVYRCEALRNVPLSATGFEIETEMLVKLARRRARIIEMPVSAVYGMERSKLRPMRDTTKTCFLAVYYRFLERM